MPTCCSRAASLIRERSFEFCAWLTLEVGKNWAEADADVGETIDFLEFYGREALRLDQAKTPIQFPGERNQLRYIPLGVGAVIPPWNFPFAIMAGMTAASIVCGNTVILKPSVDSPTIAAKFMELLEEVGLPDGVVNFCPGEGAGVRQRSRRASADPLHRLHRLQGRRPRDPRARSQDPARPDLHQADDPRDGRQGLHHRRTGLRHRRRSDGVVASAFGFNGQKCSACSRAIVAADIYDAFCDRLQERVAKLKTGDPAENVYTGPVISEKAYRKILDYIEIGKKEGTVLSGGHAIRTPEGGYYIAPTVIADVAPTARIALEEIFGPVLAVIKSHSFDDALAIANNTEYGLTGAIYTSSREKLDRARDEFYVGNLYFNRKCTGAMVGAHPFGGFNMSGTDSKAGGPDYLLLFTQAKSVAEKIGHASPEAEKQSDQMGM